MTRITLTIILLFTGCLLKGQNIYWTLHLNEQTEYKTVKPKKIIETGTYNLTTSPRNVQSTILFDDAGRIKFREWHQEEDNYTTITKYVYDTTRNILIAQINEFISHIKTTSDTTHFEYNSNQHVVGMLHKNDDNNVLRITQIINNEKGHPVKLIDLDSNGIQIRMETAVYNYEKNRVVTAVYGTDGKQYFTNSHKIDRSIASQFPDVNEKYNQQGDVIAYEGKLPDGTMHPYEIDRTYDDKGNWTESKTYEIISPGGKRERVLVMHYRREYFY